MWEVVYAMGGPPSQGAQGGPASLIATFVPLILIFLVFYFLLIRPQQKRAREHQRFVDSLHSGQKVITAGGLIGHVVKVEGDEVLLEVGKDIRVRVHKQYISGPA
ncbi:MAG TPA: preprotein translocase subunit YajC [Thermosulfurimonas dismutans]|uniref:Sec translocon accessory complex subunit YajC n=1 Tax=Thermosulfurimonas dismutans TaxID=999894 RepID=A0A7C3H4Y3_9BACT|nr:preprotein translocase subunit YajC [Thermosulfurimonas sp.]HFC98045.1 preprotein translocase subunit YajC [Thermosulfurimonas dismutans]